MSNSSSVLSATMETIIFFPFDLQMEFISIDLILSHSCYGGKKHLVTVCHLFNTLLDSVC